MALRKSQHLTRPVIHLHIDIVGIITGPGRIGRIIHIPCRFRAWLPAWSLQWSGTGNIAASAPPGTDHPPLLHRNEASVLWEGFRTAPFPSPDPPGYKAPGNPSHDLFWLLHNPAPPSAGRQALSATLPAPFLHPGPWEPGSLHSWSRRGQRAAHNSPRFTYTLCPVGSHRAVSGNHPCTAREPEGIRVFRILIDKAGSHRRIARLRMIGAIPVKKASPSSAPFI